MAAAAVHQNFYHKSLLRILCQFNPKVFHGFCQDFFVAVLHLGERHTERPYVHSHKVQSGLAGIGFTSQNRALISGIASIWIFAAPLISPSRNFMTIS